MWTPRNAVTVRNPPGGPTPASVPPSRLDAVGEALSGISAELDAELTWDFRERTAEERAMDIRPRPYLWWLHPTYADAKPAVPVFEWQSDDLVPRPRA